MLYLRKIKNEPWKLKVKFSGSEYSNISIYGWEELSAMDGFYNLFYC